MTNLDLTNVLPPLLWDDTLENLPYKAGRFQGMTAQEAMEKYLPNPYGDEIITVRYEKEVFFKGGGWEWVECPREESTRAVMETSSQLEDAEAKKWAKPLGYGYSSGYNDRT